ncbi:uncharacterized protein LOC132875025 isoform X2 [Neoarius graeffei]|uniref:uncharacterized protein LOC132875025 isoform X2 n=1 Tax=Neoarius graeffei TaxID=443677 RepID=UPI00298CD8B5|nr:uncharacterized protein LOC132875025 isoform X2 [Neoarius graeffei]
MEQMIQHLSMDEKNDECLEFDSKKENFLHFYLAMVRDTHLDEKENPEESECSTDGPEDSIEGKCSVDEVLSKGENYGMTWCTSTKHQFESVCQSIIKDAESCQVMIQSLGYIVIRPELFPPRIKRACMNHSNSDRVTIFYYNCPMKDHRNGRPVTLNFSGSDQFLKCTDKDGKAVLTLELHGVNRKSFGGDGGDLDWLS